jgi:hypothetical protein
MGPQWVPGRSGERSAREVVPARPCGAWRVCDSHCAARGQDEAVTVARSLRARSASCGCVGRSAVAVAAVLAGPGLAGCGKRARHAVPGDTPAELDPPLVAVAGSSWPDALVSGRVLPLRQSQRGGRGRAARMVPARPAPASEPLRWRSRAGRDMATIAASPYHSHQHA